MVSEKYALFLLDDDQGMTKLMEEEIQPILVPAVLEHEGISGISGGDKPRSALPHLPIFPFTPFTWLDF